MKKSKLISRSFLCSSGSFVYILLVAWIIRNGEKWFGKASNFWGPVIFLTLFVFSALITGLLVLGYPIWLYLEQKKKESLVMLFFNVGWLFIFLLLAIIGFVA